MLLKEVRGPDWRLAGQVLELPSCPLGLVVESCRLLQHWEALLPASQTLGQPPVCSLPQWMANGPGLSNMLGFLLSLEFHFTASFLRTKCRESDCHTLPFLRDFEQLWFKLLWLPYFFIYHVWKTRTTWAALPSSVVSWKCSLIPLDQWPSRIYLRKEFPRQFISHREPLRQHSQSWLFFQMNLHCLRFSLWWVLSCPQGTFPIVTK